MKKRRWLLLLGLWPPASWAGDALPEVMRALAAVPSVEAMFREEKTLALLQEPLVTQGILYYRAPAYLRKRTLEPHPEEFQADGDWLTIETPDQGRRDWHLPGYPQLRPFVEAIRATQAGDRATLERYYRLEFQGTLDDWRLRLTPHDPDIAQYLTLIVVHGRKDWIDRMEILEADGDRSVMTVTPR